MKTSALNAANAELSFEFAHWFAIVCTPIIFITERNLANADVTYVSLDNEAELCSQISILEHDFHVILESRDCSIRALALARFHQDSDEDLTPI